MLPGTPDGMFETWDGALTCVQVVRVPLLAGMSQQCMQEAIAQTMLTKVVKSQQWLRACRVLSCDFVIFCWLPFFIPDEVEVDAEALMEGVRKLDERFSLRLRVPAEAGALFPARFATSTRERDRKSLESDVCAFTSTCGVSEDDEEELPWDITWAWDESMDDANEVPHGANEAGDACEEVKSDVSSNDRDVEPQWDITWDWQEGSYFGNDMNLVADEFDVSSMIQSMFAESLPHHD